MTTAANVDVSGLLRRYERPLALGRVLCRDHPPEAPAVLAEDVRGPRTATYGELGERARALAVVLAEAGVGKGDRVAVLLPRSLDLVVAVLAVWHVGAVQVPLFTAFGPDAVRHRLAHSGARLTIADPANRPKVEAGRQVLCLGGPGMPGDIDGHAAAARAGALEGRRVEPADPFVLLYTSGTTGSPKGVVVPVRALAAFEAYMRLSAELRGDDVFWNLSDTGWGYGLWFGVIGALLLGQRMLLRNVPFDPEDTLDAIVRHGITNLTGSPTAFRAMRAHRRSGAPLEGSAVRVISTAGEALNPELLAWSRSVFGTPIHDHYGQSEVGMVAGFHHAEPLSREVVPASMGTALPGFRLAVLSPEGEEVEDGGVGELAVDTTRSPLYWFRGYYKAPDRTAERFRHGPRYYLTGDTVRAVGPTLFFSSRADDVITSSGYRIGPFDVENALMSHPSVAEVAVVGTPDALRGEAVTAFVVLGGEAPGGEPLAQELRQLVRDRVSRHLYPRRVVFVEQLPKTESGKVKRDVLRRK